jgi:hypothetical protein
VTALACLFPTWGDVVAFLVLATMAAVIGLYLVTQDEWEDDGE